MAAGHEDVICVAGQTFCLSGSSGQMRSGGEHGLYVGDVRLLSTLLLRIDGEEPQPLRAYAAGGSGARFTSCKASADHGDPAVVIERRRVVSDGMREQIACHNYSVDPVTIRVELEAIADFAHIFDVKHGRGLTHAPCTVVRGGLQFGHHGSPPGAALMTDPPASEVVSGTMQWSIDLESGASWTLDVLVTATDEPSAAGRARRRARWPRPTSTDRAAMTVACSDDRLTRLVAQSRTDLASLLVRDPDTGYRFYAAGSPWFLTLFGRDSLWAALMSLPLGTEVAGETLRLLARMQGSRHDHETEEAPGKIPHELRRGALAERSDLPPLYYGTVDATPLFVTVLERAWSWGLPNAVVEALLPHAERALEWLEHDGDPDSDGFIEYAAQGERRLANQGWKDSGDAVFFADGTLASAPIALCEVQGYAYDAAMRGARLLDAFGRDGGDHWRAWAAALRDAFRDRFWVGTGDRPFPAIALDGTKRPVDTIASNMGHLPGTGMLDQGECELVAAALGRPDMDSGWGLRTASATSPRFNPLSYHGGSVWPHDTAIAVDNLARSGVGGLVAGSLLRGLLAAGDAFDSRLPELFGGEQRERDIPPLPYPAACRPQAWAAGSALLLLRAALGIEPDVPAGILRIQPLRPAPFKQLSIAGMPLAGGILSMTVDEGHVTVTDAPDGLDVVIGDEAETGG